MRQAGVPEGEIEELRRFVDDLNAEAGPIVVEGKRDARALRGIGVTARVVEFHRFGGPNCFADAAARSPKVIMLLDRDRSGRALTSRIIEKAGRRTTVDLSFGRRLARITRGRVRFVEQLSGYGDLMG